MTTSILTDEGHANACVIACSAFLETVSAAGRAGLTTALRTLTPDEVRGPFNVNPHTYRVSAKRVTTLAGVPQ